jgi:hypothetical protein
MTPIVLLLASCQALRTTPTTTTAAAAGTASANLTEAVNAWSATRTQSVLATVNSDPSNIKINDALKSIVTYIDPTVNPMAELASDGKTSYEQSIQDNIASSVTVPTSIITALNDTSDLVKSQFNSMDVNFTYVNPGLFSVSVASLGSKYSSYALPSTQYSNLVQYSSVEFQIEQLINE